METIVWLIVPCYNEEDALNFTIQALLEKIRELTQCSKVSSHSKILFVDDGSSDSTWDIICRAHQKDSTVTGIKLAHNQGHQNALLAGMLYAKNKCDCIISLDADLQDDIGVLGEFIDKYQDGCQVVYGIRKSRKKDSWFKRNTAQLFYKLMHVAGGEVIYNHADYRLMSRKALNALEQFEEVNLFLRGIIPLIGMKSDFVLYERDERVAGKSKYPLKKMIAFAIQGITSFSVKPLKMITWLGAIFSIVSLSGLLYALISYFCGVTVKGWTAIVCSIWLMGGVVMLSIGVLGEYIGKIYSEVKKRPKYIIDEELKDD